MGDINYVGKVNPKAKTAGNISPDAVVQLIKWYVNNEGLVGTGSTSSSETDPVFTASAAAGITPTQIANWDTALLDADFSANGLMKRTAAGVYTTITDNSANWDAADNYGSWQLNVDVSSIGITSGFALEFAGGTGIDVSYAAGVVTIAQASGADNYADSVTFAVGTGLLSIGRTGALPDLSFNLDGRYLLDPSGLSTQFIKGDGSLDSTTYAPASTTLAGYGISDTTTNFNTALTGDDFLFVSDATETSTASKVVKRDSSKNIYVNNVIFGA